MKEKSLIDELHLVQDVEEKNYLPFDKAIKITKNRNIPISRIYSTATFYTMFSTKPRGKHIIRVCRNLSCHLEGSEAIANKLKEILGVDFGETTKDGEFTLEESSCLGMCSVSPAMMIDDESFGRLTPDKIPEILKKIREGDKK